MYGFGLPFHVPSSTAVSAQESTLSSSSGLAGMATKCWTRSFQRTSPSSREFPPRCESSCKLTIKNQYHDMSDCNLTTSWPVVAVVLVIQVRAPLLFAFEVSRATPLIETCFSINQKDMSIMRAATRYTRVSQSCHFSGMSQSTTELWSASDVHPPSPGKRQQTNSCHQSRSRRDGYLFTPDNVRLR